MQSSHWSRSIATIILFAMFAVSGAASAQDYFTVPEHMAGQLPDGVEILHEYGQRTLVSVPEGRGELLDQRRASRLEDPTLLSYRIWRGRAVNHDPASLEDLRDAYFILALVGPMDPQWRSQIEGFGLTVVDHVNPYGVLVRGDSGAVQAAAESILTTRQRPVITQALPLPRSSRISSDIAQWMSGRSAAEDLGIRMDGSQVLVRVVPHNDVDFDQLHSQITQFIQPGPEYVAENFSRQYRASADALTDLLDGIPEVGYVHAVHPREQHNNITPQEHVTNIKPVWDNFGYIGTGLIAGVNDSGVDMTHADFPSGTILATVGAMSGTDNGHGTHVSGTVLGRGAAPSPTNTSSCGDITPPLPDARGMAHGAQLTHNNIFDGGVTSEAGMMQWQSEQGAVVNNNSWGYGGLFGPVTTYDSETVAIDAAVRDADPTSGINSQMGIVFSAGNSAEAGVSKPGNGKNVITVGASQNDRCGSYIPSQCAGPDIDSMACFSSQGPSQGRIKPEIVAPGTDVLSTGSSDPNATWGGWDQPWTGDEYAIVPGTSMSAPVVTGASVLFMEHYLDSTGGLPSPALVKAALVNTATDMGLGFPSNIQGWGRLNLNKAIEGPVEDGIVYFDQDDVDHLETGQSWTVPIGVASADEPLRITLAWTDPPGTSGCNPCHVNDLDLVVTGPDGTIYRGNQFSANWSEPDATGRDELNNLENVYIEAPMAGEYTVEITAFNVAQNPNLLDGQDFALVATGNFGGISVDPASAEVCVADGSTDFTVVLSNQFQGTTNLSAVGLPAGTNGDFNPNPVIFPDDESIFTLSDLGSAAGGDYAFEISAIDDDDSENFADSTVDLTLYEAAPGTPDPLTPADNSIDVDLTPEFTWTSATEGALYQIQIATDATFDTIVIDETVEGTSFVPADDLATGSDFFWRVRSNNACGDGNWSVTFEFQTRFEPIADINPNSFLIQLAPDATADDTLFIENIGTGNLVWDIETDSIEEAGLVQQGHDPALDEVFPLGDFTLVADASNPEEIVFQLPVGVATRGDVVGFSFIGTADPGGSWASDSCMIIESPDGTIYGVGGFSSGMEHCGSSGRDAPWDFQGSGSSSPGTYESEHDDAFDPPLADEGTWTVTFFNGWLSSAASDIIWEDVELTLHKQPLPVCIGEELANVPWLSVSPESGSTPPGAPDEVTVTVDSTGLVHGTYEAHLCVTTNTTVGSQLVAIPVTADVVDPTAGELQGTVDTAGYCHDDPSLVSGASVVIQGQLNTYEVTTDVDGFYSIEFSDNENPVDITVSSDGYLNATATGVNIVAGDVVVEDFELLLDAACAQITPESFDFEVTLGNTDSDLLNISNANGNVDLEWSVDHFEEAGGEAAPLSEHIVVLVEDFEGPFPPDDWTDIDDGGNCPWLTSDDYGMSGWAGTDERGAAVDDDACGSGAGNSDASLITPSMDLTGVADTLLTFDLALRTSTGTELTLDVSTDGGGSWDNLESWTSNVAYPGDVSAPIEVDLSAYDGEPDVQLRWRYTTTGWHWWVFIDNVVIEEVPPPPPPPSCEHPNDVSWIDLSPDTGITAPGNSDDVTVAVNTVGLEDGVYEATICVTTDDPSVEMTHVPVSMTVNDPELATFTGTVTGQVCSEDPQILSGALITIDGALDSYTTETDADGSYFIKVHEDESPADVTVSMDGYVPQTTEGVTFVGLDVIEADYNLALDTACLDIDPDELSAVIGLDETVDLFVDIGNLGSQTLIWDIVAEGMNMADIRAARDPENAEKLRQIDEPLIGFNFTTSTSSTEDPQNWNRISSADGLMEDVQDDTGAATSVNIEWGGLTTAGFVFLSTNNVAEDAVPQFHYDLSGMSGYGFRSNGHFFIELSGLQPNVDYEYWFVGYRSTSGIDNVVQVSDGDTINAFEFNQFITVGDNDGRFVINDLVSEDTQEFNDLSFLTRSSSTGTIRFEWEGDTQTTVIGALAIRQATDCAIPDWLSLDPMSGSVDSGAGPDTVTATLDPTGLAPGVYEGNFCVESNDPVTPLVEVPVTMTTELPADWGAITGTVASLGHCQADDIPLEGAMVEVVGSLDTYTVETDENGFYEIYLPEGESPLTITASADNHLSNSTTVNFAGGDAITADIDLLLEEPCASVQPGGISIDLDADEQTSGFIELGNVLGNATLNWQIDTALPADFRPDDTGGNSPRSFAGDGGAAVSLNELLGGEPQSQGVIQPFQTAIDCESASGLIINDDGTVENGYSGNPDVVNDVEFVDYFVPANHPASLNAVCLSLVRLTGGPASMDIQIVVYADDGPDGTPGTQIGSMNATVDNIPVWPISAPTWASFDISSMDVAIASGGVYVGVGYQPTAPNVFIASDESTDNPVAHAGGHWWNDSANEWIPVQESWEDYRALFVRVQEGVIDCSNPQGVPWLGVDPSFGLVHAGNTREIEVSLDATGLQPGLYEAGLCIFSNDPVNPVLTVPVTMNVRIPSNWATVEGTVSTLGHCSENPGVLEGASIEIAGSSNIYNATTDASGNYQVSLPAGEAPIDVMASHPAHLPETEAGVGLVAGDTSVVDLDLVLESGCTDHDPDSFDITLITGENTSELLSLINAGAGDSDFEVTSAQTSVPPEAMTTVELVRTAIESRGFEDDENSRAIGAGAVTESRREISIITTREDLNVVVLSPDTTAPTNLVNDLDSFPDVNAELYPGDLGTITGGDLAGYDVAVLVNNNQWTVIPGADVAVGDALADFIDDGGAALVFNYTFDTFGWELAGRFIDEEYGPFGMASNETLAASSMVVLDDTHPIMEGVVSLSNGASAPRLHNALQGDPVLIAEWADGHPLVAYNDHVVAMNVLYSSNGTPGDWTGDLDLMAYNAVRFIVAGEGEPAEWLSFDPEVGTVVSEGSSEVAVTFDAQGLVAGTYEANILVHLGEGGDDGTTLSIPTTLQVVDPAVIDVDPTSLSAVLEEGGTDVQSFNIANSGEATLEWSIDDSTAGCELPGWASVDPLSGSVDSGNDENVGVTFDATGLDAGVYDATICVDSNDPGNPVVEVDLQLTVDETLATVEGIVMSLGYCGESPAAAGGAGILIDGQTGTYSGTADGTGFYQIDVPADESPVSVSASHGGHITDIVTGVTLTAGESTTVDIDLVLEAPCAAISPLAFSFSLSEGDASETLTIDNSGGGASLSWTLEAGTGCYESTADTWLTLSSSGDTVGAGSSQAVDVTADASGMESGQYVAELCIGTDDGEADEFRIPVELNVQGEVIFHDRFESDEAN